MADVTDPGPTGRSGGTGDGRPPDPAPHPDRSPGPPLDPPVADAVARLARVPRLLVASDYDGVLAPIVTEPAHAFPLPESVTALWGLAALPDTTVALVSGRARADLAALARPPEQVWLVGSHGAELVDGVTLDPARNRLRDRLVATVGDIVADHPGARLELKPASVVVHTRGAPAGVSTAVSRAVRDGPGGWPGVHLTTGKEVVELAVVTAHKGTAVTALRERVSPDAVLFVGDDVTDENGFAALTGADVGIKVGSGETRADLRVPDPPAVARVLRALLDARTAARGPGRSG